MMALRAELLYDFWADEPSSANNYDLHFVPSFHFLPRHSKPPIRAQTTRNPFWVEGSSCPSHASELSGPSVRKRDDRAFASVFVIDRRTIFHRNVLMCIFSLSFCDTEMLAVLI